ncbi:hypothetical protein MtrunA17_Chr7g0219491 [Medicago truncatula]|uniref:Uncharacterized protein n=1 Tax=Medicago truncatula TaxID=3880 RepID=A0A396GTJ5_MEDTR|nr:hypothetical protein MtrunA17_Chr7g0219491 [Medicago truncatula]
MAGMFRLGILSSPFRFCFCCCNLFFSSSPVIETWALWVIQVSH